ncbi:hypothetical protein GCM10009844_36090 [Nocardioides koreensis]|uniref:DUF4430 domain-containing protein n=1 Tax=Nocardioides koreensis TaxID=433651 RepID=A0ABN3A2G6_9ACTN
MGSLVRRAVVVMVTAAAALPAGPAPASAAAASCAAGHGVTVVVEFNELGRDDLDVCDEAGGGRTVARLLEANRLPLTYVQRQPGFVCRVAGLPEQDPCVNTPPDDAYWSLWWSDGSSDTWSYATTGVDSLEVPDGGSVALAWDGDEGEVLPATPPGAPAAPAPRTDVRADAAATSGRVSRDDGGLPAWVAPSAVGLLLAAAAGTAVVRRRRGTPRP